MFRRIFLCSEKEKCASVLNSSTGLLNSSPYESDCNQEILNSLYVQLVHKNYMTRKREITTQSFGKRMINTMGIKETL